MNIQGLDIISQLISSSLNNQSHAPLSPDVSQDNLPTGLGGDMDMLSQIGSFVQNMNLPSQTPGGWDGATRTLQEEQSLYPQTQQPEVNPRMQTIQDLLGQLNAANQQTDTSQQYSPAVNQSPESQGTSALGGIGSFIDNLIGLQNKPVEDFGKQIGRFMENISQSYNPETGQEGMLQKLVREASSTYNPGLYDSLTREKQAKDTAYSTGVKAKSDKEIADGKIKADAKAATIKYEHEAAEGNENRELKKEIADAANRTTLTGVFSKIASDKYIAKQKIENDKAEGALLTSATNTFNKATPEVKEAAATIYASGNPYEVDGYRQFVFRPRTKEQGAFIADQAVNLPVAVGYRYDKENTGKNDKGLELARKEIAKMREGEEPELTAQEARDLDILTKLYYKRGEDALLAMLRCVNSSAGLSSQDLASLIAIMEERRNSRPLDMVNQTVTGDNPKTKVKVGNEGF